MDRSISDRLAQPKPCSARPTEEQAHEKDEKESRSGIQGQRGVGGITGRQDAGWPAQAFDVQANQIVEWKPQMVDRAAEVFGGEPASKPPAQPDINVLHAKMGQLTLENNFLEGALTKAGWLSARR